jgi:biopolymer transport protein ExbD
MPIHAPGPQLFSSVPFKFLGGGKQGGRKESNVSLNVVPFVDMMTILVTFLLMTFSATGELITAQKGVDLPRAFNEAELRKAPVVIVSRDAITFNGEMMEETRAVADDPSMEWKIIELYERLKAEKAAFELNFDQLSNDEKEKCRAPVPSDDPKMWCLRGLVILQADKSTNAKVINRVLKTAYAADYRNIMFAINARSRGP